MKKIINRAKAPTPKFFKVLRTVGLALAAVGGTILAAPIALPAIVHRTENFPYNQSAGKRNHQHLLLSERLF